MLDYTTTCVGRIYCEGANRMDSKAIGVRVKTETIERVMERANRRGWTFNRWVNYAIELGLRSHKRKDDANQV